MKKVILGLALVIVLALAAGVYYVLTNLDGIVKTAIEKHGSEATQTAVRVDKVRIKLDASTTVGAGTISGLTIANPKGFALSHAFSLGEITTGINLKSLKAEPYIIDEITVRAPQVFVEINEDNKNNLNELKKNLTAGAQQAKQKKAADKTAAKEPRLIIKRILFTDGNIKAKVVPLKDKDGNDKEYDLKLPTIKMSNLGGKAGATPTELATIIIDRLIDQAKKEIKKKGIDAELDKYKAKLKGKAEAKVEEEKAKLKEEADTKLDEEKQKAEDKLKGLLK